MGEEVAIFTEMADKTHFPGFDRDDDSSQFDSTRYSNRFSSGMSSDISSGSSEKVGEGTVISSIGNASGLDKKNSNGNAVKPILGFLYSVSRTSYGEYWPLYLGPNKIGRSRSSDIVLNEGTVSSEHAMVTIHIDEDANELYAVIEDTHSTNGVRLNGTNIRFEKVECHNMDVIKIGKAYELLLILIDSARYGLKLCPDFIETQKAAPVKSGRIINGPTPSENPFTRINNPSRSDKTQSLDSEPEFGGGTKTR